MTTALPAMQGLLALGPSGPFPEGSEPQWFPHADGTVRHLSLRGYRDAMINERADPGAATETVLRMAEHGCQKILWAAANGGRRGQINATWDARVAALTTPAATAVPYVTGWPAGLAPAGTTEVVQLVGQPGVLHAYRMPVGPLSMKIAMPSPLAQALGMKGRVKFRFRQTGYASLAVGHVGATAVVAAGDPAAAEEALSRLVEVLVADMREAG